MHAIFGFSRFYCMIGSHLKFALLVPSFHQNPMEMRRLADPKL